MPQSIPSRYSLFTSLSGSPTSIAAVLLLLVLLVASCGTAPQTIVVGGEARGPEAAEETEVTDAPEPALAVLKIGESNRILSMDPLFALNTATKRTIMLAYEGLVRLDQDDLVVPAAARRWDVSPDSLTWTFHLRRDLFFHDDESFAQGRGRRVNARDVVRVFERMASRDVPSNAAELFMNTIQGFEPFFLEHQEIFFARDRQVTSISGLEATSDSTIVFRLLQPESDFLARLSSPYAVLYPAEPFLFRNEGLHRRAVGTGAFRHESSVGDSIHVFVRHANYHERDDRGRRLPLPARVEVMNITDELRLYDHFRHGRLNMIADAGPLTVDRLFGGATDPGAEQQPDAENQADAAPRAGSPAPAGNHDSYRVVRLNNPDPVVLRFNTRNRSGLARSDAASVVRHVSDERIAEHFVNPSLTITYKDTVFTQTNIGRVFRRFGEGSDQRMVIAYNRDHLPRMLSRAVTGSIDANLQTVLLQRRVFSSDIFLYVDYLQTMVPGTVHERQPQELMRFETDRFMLLDHNNDGVRTNSLSWWMDLRHVRRAASGQRQADAAPGL